MPDTPWPGDTCSLVDAFRRGECRPVVAGVLRSACARRSRRLAAQRLRHRRRGGVGGGAPRRRRAPLRRRPDRRQGTRPRGRLAEHVGLRPTKRPRRHAHVNHGRAPQHGRRRDPHRHDNRERVRWRQLHAHRPQRRHPQSLESRSHPRRLVRWHRRRRSGGILTLGTAGDGGGSIRIPAGFCGLVGLKVTRGRIPRGPHAELGNFTTVIGTCCRSVRDAARWVDVTNGFDAATRSASLAVEGWEAGLGTYGDTIKGLRVAIVDDWAARPSRPQPSRSCTRRPRL